MPGEEQLPRGPRRDLVGALHELYELAGKPATRRISADIREHDDLPGTLSHEGVSTILRGVGGVPRWQNLESLVRALLDRAVTRRSPEDEVLRIHELWRLADSGLTSSIDLLSDQPHDVFGIPVGHESDLTDARTSPEDASQEDTAVAGDADRPGVTWNHPRYGRFDFYDKKMVPEVIREVGKLDD